jgi:acetaldehyde dehydrogenase/alcohol dehydrogenase
MWYFYSPNIIYGIDALNFLENIVGNKCLIVSDKVIEEIGHLKILTDKINAYGKEWKVFLDVVPDPRYDDVLKGKKICLSYKPDSIIALGGGSVMDTAKTMWVLYEFPEFSMDADIHPFNNALFNLGKKANFIAIPTTSGTGSETSIGVVISKKEGKDIWRKMELAHPALVPTWAIVDPIFPVGMSPQLTAITGFDALTHCFENVISQWKNEFSEALTLKAIELIFKYLPLAYKDGKNIEARDFMHQAATMAGLAFSNSMAQLGHSLGHSLGAVFHVPHGKCVGVFLTYVLEYCFNNPDQSDKSINIVGTISKRLGWANWNEDIKKAANIAIDKIKELQKQLDFPTKIKDLKISKNDLENNLNTLVDLCYQSPLSTACPRSTQTGDFEKIFQYAFEGKDIDF